MKILVLASTYPLHKGDTTPGFVHELARRLVARGHQVSVLTPSVAGAQPREIMDGVQISRFRYAPRRLETLLGSGGIVSRLRQRPLRLLLVPLMLGAFGFAVVRAVRRERVDVIHAHWLIPQGLLLALLTPWLRGVPFLCTAHGGDLFALRAPLFRPLRRLVVRRAARVTVVSRYMREVLLREVDAAQKVEVASMGVDLAELFRPDPRVARDSEHVIFVGRLVEKKGVAVVLDALARLGARYDNVRLSIVGDGPERPALERLAHALGLADRVRFLGARPQAALPALYSSAAIAVVPSIVDSLGDQEGLGLVSLEAIGCGCAVLASDLEAIRDVVIDGRTGLLARAGDAADWALRLGALLDDAPLRARLGRDARAQLMDFDWERVAARYAELLRDIATD